ncbi:hypothetical protein LUZ63_004446 [Rhynchospora breviuscula]|uniref:Nucleotide-diphospho-sugar transferase domain-containing protein n=1 Tax=Rhynchospora breviuscula TaxID=2022672 RepID=A0A9Q0I027_9POAL|nr:hypothetical protein LUZ63_004446 [Rhynchospora breviuscula]
MRSSTFLLGASLVLVFLVLYTSSDLSEGARKQKESLREATRKVASTQLERTEKSTDGINSEIVHRKEKIVHRRRSRNNRITEGLKTQRKRIDSKKIIETVTAHDQAEDISDLLKRVATPDKTIIMTAINDAWTAPGSLLDLFFESFHHGDQILHMLNHLVIVAMDQKAFEKCKSQHPHCYLLRVDGLNFASEQSYMKGDYLEIMWRRNRFQQSILELGYNFLFTDVDIVWFHNPFPHLSQEADLIMSTDFFVGDPKSLGNYPNGGLLYVRSGHNTIEFYKNWQLSRQQFPGKHEQYTFDKIKGELSARLGVKIQFLDTA